MLLEQSEGFTHHFRSEVFERRRNHFDLLSRTSRLRRKANCHADPACGRGICCFLLRTTNFGDGPPCRSIFPHPGSGVKAVFALAYPSNNRPPGSSTNCLTFTKNCTASRPSTMR